MNVTPPTVTEVRIHGVGGGTPEDILGSGDYKRIDGDSSDPVGFYRKTKPVGDPSRVLEAYSWGGFSGRNFIRAFWILLLPFAMVNVAGWMVNPDSGSTSIAIQRAMVRLVAVAQTIMVVVWLGAIAVDVIAVEPAGHRVVFAALVPAVAVAVLVLASRRSELYESYPEPGNGPSSQLREDTIGPRDPLFWRTGPFIRAQRHRHTTVATATIAALLSGWVWVVSGSTTGALVAIAALVLIAIEALLTALRVAVNTGVGSTIAAIALAVFSAFTAWSTTVDSIPVWPAATGSQPVFAEAPLWVLAGTGIVLLVLAVAEISGWIRRGRGVAIWESGFPLSASRALVATAVLALIVAAGWMSTMKWWSDFWWVRVALLTAFGVALALILWIISRHFRRWILGALVLIWVPTVAAWLVSDNRAWWWVGAAAAVFFFAVAAFAETGRRDRYRWLPATSTATLSLVPLTVTMAAAATILNGWFGTAKALPTGYAWIMATFTGVALIVLAGVGFHLLRRRIEVHRTGPIENEYPEASDDCKARMAKKAALWRSLSDVLRDIDVVVSVVGGGIALILIGALLRVGRADLELWSWERWHQGLFTSDFPSSWTYLAALGTVVGLILPFAALLLILSTIWIPAMRSRVGVVWDVGTFWPRRFHPLAPPAYSERAVPEIARYVSNLATERGVVVAAHSQGAVLLAAALLQMQDGTNFARIATLTHGSPLGVFYRRFWPGTFGGGVYAELREALVKTSNHSTHQGWWNAFRLTDPIAEEVFSGPDEQPGIVTDMRIPDPRWIDKKPCRGTSVHSGYLGDSEVEAKMNELVTLVG